MASPGTQRCQAFCLPVPSLDILQFHQIDSSSLSVGIESLLHSISLLDGQQQFVGIELAWDLEWAKVWWCVWKKQSQRHSVVVAQS